MVMKKPMPMAIAIRIVLGTALNNAPWASNYARVGELARGTGHSSGIPGASS